MNIFCKCLCVNHTVYQLEYSSQKHCIRFATTLSFCKWFLPYEMLYVANKSWFTLSGNGSRKKRVKKDLLYFSVF